jgi:hypothetical protein
VSGDDVVENDEWFQIALSGGTGVDQVTTIDPRNGGNAFYNADSWVAGFPAAPVQQHQLRLPVRRNRTGRSPVRPGQPRQHRRNGSFSYVSSKLEGDTLADGGPSDDYIEHVFAVRRTIATSGTAWVEWKLSNGVGGYVATDINDFKPGQDALGTNGGFASGRLNFADGQEWGYIKVYHPRQRGRIRRGLPRHLTTTSGGSSFDSNPDGAGYNNNYLVLSNDDTRFDASANDVTEGNIVTFTVTRQGDTRGTDTVDWSLTLPGSETTNEGNTNTSSWYKLDPSDISGVTTSNGTATFNAGAWTGTLTFEDGETTKTISVQTVDDAWTESWRENLGIVLSNANNMDAGEANHDLETASHRLSGHRRIYDNDADPLISVTASTTTIFEGTGASNSADGNTVTFTITRTDQAGLDGALNYPTTVGWYLSGSAINWGSAANELIKTYGGANRAYEYTASPPTATWCSMPAKPKQVTVTFYGDNYVESETPITFNVVSARPVKAGCTTSMAPAQNGYGPANVDNTAASVTERAQRRHPPLCRRLGHQRWGHQRLLHQRADQRL